MSTLQELYQHSHSTAAMLSKPCSVDSTYANGMAFSISVGKLPPRVTVARLTEIFFHPAWNSPLSIDIIGEKQA